MTHQPVGYDTDGRPFDCEACGEPWPCGATRRFVPFAEIEDELIRVTFDFSCEVIDGVRVLHDGEEVWQDGSYDVSQYLMHYAPKGPVVLEVQ